MSEWLPLTAAQRGLFFAHQLAPDNPCYTTAEVVEFGGRIDADRLWGALATTYDEFEQCRVELALTAAGPRQRVRPHAQVQWQVIEVDSVEAAESWMRDQLDQPLAILDGELIRTALLRTPASDWWFHAAHHVVLDGYGVQQLFRRVAEHYGGAAKELRRVSVAELVAAEPEVTAEAQSWWAARVDQYSGPSSLAGHIASPAPQAARRALELPEDLQRSVVAGAKRLGVPWSDLFTAGVGTYLARMVSQPAIRVGLPLMNRTQPGIGALPAAHTVCTAMNVLPVTVLGVGSVGEVLAQTASEQVAIRAQPWVRQEELTRALGGRGQLFGAQVNVIPFDLELRFSTPSAAVAVPGDPVHGVVRNLTAGPVEDLTIGLRGVPGRGRSVRLELDANPDLYPDEELDAHLERLVRWLSRWASADSEDRVEQFALVSAAERALVVEEFNATDHPRESATLAQRFAVAVQRQPEAIALRFNGEHRSYAELAAAATALAHALTARGIGAGDVVGLKLERSFGLYEALHAVILVGAVYLPLDPDLPADRITMMVEDAGAAVVLEAADLAHMRATVATPATPAATAATDLGAPSEVDTPAYVLFTSGSTGRPKGVQISHRAIDNRLAWMQHHLPIGPGDVVVHKTPISFDVSIWELLWPLQVGACVEIAPPGAHRDPRALAPLLAGASVVHFVPSMLRAFLRDRVARQYLGDHGGVRHLVTSGEALTPDLVETAAQWFGVAPTNLYGPTEAAVDVTVWDCRVGESSVPIGFPIWNTSCFVLDPHLEPVPVGAVGELWLGGVQLADGYVGREDLTDERFIDTAEYGRVYRTGDLAAWRPDGALRYLGRTDDQVKVRGQRVELGEIENVIASLPAIDGAVVAVVEDRLVCWVRRTEPEVELDPALVRAQLADRLPAAWIPSRWVSVAQIPVGTAGKADRRALIAALPTHAEAGLAPTTLLEQQVSAVMGQCLGRSDTEPALAVDADFFDEGGDSLRVLTLLSEIEETWQVELTLAAVFAHPTAQGLAALVEQAVAGGDPRSGSSGGGDGAVEAEGAVSGVVSGVAELLALRRGLPGQTPLFFLPPAGGLGWCYLGLLRWLPKEIPVYALQAPGLGEGTPEQVATMTDLGRRQLETIRHVVGAGPFHVAGWSLGGMAAHAVAALARSTGQEVGEVIALDSYPTEQWGPLGEPTEYDALLGLLRLGAVTVPDGTELSREVVVQRLKESGSALASLPDSVIEGCIASVIQAARLVRTEAPQCLEGAMTMVVAAAPRVETWLDPTGWFDHVAGELTVTEIDCTHGELVSRAEVGELLARRLAPLVG